MLRESINEMIVSLTENAKCSTKSFQENSKAFIELLTKSVTYHHWSNLLILQSKELNIILKEFDDKELNSASTSDKVPIPDILGPPNFVPLFNERDKLSCSAPTCKSRFSFLRSYEKHMRHYHPEILIDKTKKDPKAICRLISKETNRTCESKLPLRSMIYHLEHLHDFKKPQNHMLWGFQVQSPPTPVFVKKGEFMQFQATPNSVATPQNLNIGPSSSKKSNNDVNKTQEGNKNNDRISARSKKTKAVQLKKHIASGTEDCNIGLGLSMNRSSGNLDEDKTVVAQPQEDDHATKTTIDLNQMTPISVRSKGKKRKLLSSLENEIEIHQEKLYSPPVAATESFENIEEDITQLHSPEKIGDNSSECSSDQNFDSDYESQDEDSYNELRMRNKRIRYKNRNKSKYLSLSERPQNVKFIEDMKSFMSRDTIATANKTNSTWLKAMKQLFTATDSFLAFEVGKNEDFNLEMLRAFKSEDFQHLLYPLDWLVATCSREDGGKGVERLKAHADLREWFI